MGTDRESVSPTGWCEMCPMMSCAACDGNVRCDDSAHAATFITAAATAAAVATAIGIAPPTSCVRDHQSIGVSGAWNHCCQAQGGLGSSRIDGCGVHPLGWFPPLVSLLCRPHPSTSRVV